MKRKVHRSMKRSIDATRTSLAAATTMAARTPILVNAALSASPRAMLESQRMVSEKIQAAGEGWLRFGAAWSNLMWRSALGMARPGNVLHEMEKLADAALAPARKACRANARRYRRRKR